MSRPGDPSRDLLFGLLALQNGLIDQGALFAAFAAWTRDRDRPLADHLVDLGHLDAPRRAAIEAIADLHVETLGGDPGKSLAALAVGRSTRESLARAGGPEVETTLGHVGPAQASTRDGYDPELDRQLCRGLGHLRRTAVPRPPPPCQGRPGRRLRRPRLRARPRGRPQADPRRPRRRPHQSIPLPHRGPDHRRAGAPRDRPRLRAGHPRRRPPLLRHAVHPRRQPQGSDRPLPRGAAPGRPHRLARPRAPQAAPPIPGRLQRHRLCPLPRRDPPRHQAGQYHPGPARRDPGRRLGAGQADRPRRAGDRVGRAAAHAVRGQRQFRDAARQHPGHPGLHEPRAGRGPARPTGPAVGYLQPGCDALLPADRQAAVRGQGGRHARRRAAGRVPSAAPARPLDRQGTGSRLPQGDGPGAGGSLRNAPGPGRRHRALAGRRAGQGLRRAPARAARALAPSTSNLDLRGRRRADRDLPGRDDRRRRGRPGEAPGSRCPQGGRGQLQHGPQGRRRLLDERQREHAVQTPGFRRYSQTPTGTAQFRARVLQEVREPAEP